MSICGRDGTYKAYPLAPLQAKLLSPQSVKSVMFYTSVYVAMLAADFCAAKDAARARGACHAGSLRSCTCHSECCQRVGCAGVSGVHSPQRFGPGSVGRSAKRRKVDLEAACRAYC